MNFKEYLEEQHILDDSINESNLTLSEAAQVDVNSIYPDPKDIQRANNISTPQKAAAQAKAIKDPLKLIRRYKAVLSVHGVGSISDEFKNKMPDMGFTTKQINDINSSSTITAPVKKSNPPAKRSGKKFEKKWSDWRAIMSARSVYSGKLSKVIKELTGQNVILIGKSNGSRKVAIIGSASGIKNGENALDYYGIPNDGELVHKFDTGNGYRESSSEIIITDYILVDNGEAVTDYIDASYTYFVFK